MLYRWHKQQRSRFAWFQLWGGRSASPLQSHCSKHNSTSSREENMMDNLEYLNRRRSPQQNLTEHRATGNMTQCTNKAAMANTSPSTSLINCTYNPTIPEITSSRFHNVFQILTLSASPSSTEYYKLMLGNWKTFD